MGHCRLGHPSVRICTLSLCTVSAWIMNADRGNAAPRRLQQVFNGARTSPILGPVFLFPTFVVCFLSSPLLSFQIPTSCSPTLMCFTCTQSSLPPLCIYGAFRCAMEVRISESVFTFQCICSGKKLAGHSLQMGEVCDLHKQLQQLM